MEDDNGLELSLGLSFGGSSGKGKAKNCSSSDIWTEEGDKGSKIVGDFKTFLHSGTHKQDPSTGSQRNDSVKPKENFFNNLSRATAEPDASMNRIWVTNNSRSADLEEEKQSDAGNKRKLLFNEMNSQKKHEREPLTDLHDKAKTPHLSITTEDGSTAENEDVAESEVEGSTSRFILHHEDGSKRFVGVSSSSEVSKEVRGFSDTNVMDLQGKKTFSASGEDEFKLGNMTYGIPFSVQSANVMNVPYSLPSKDPNSGGAPSTSGHSLSGIAQMMPTTSSERSGAQSVNPGNLPVMFGYSPVQLPMLDKDGSWGLVSHSQPFHPSYGSRGPPTSDKHNDSLKISQAAMQAITRNSSDGTLYDGRTIERTKAEGKMQAGEEGFSSQTEDVKGSGINLRVKDPSERPGAESFSLDFSEIKPGIAADLKFGGCGSCPNLPWVSTTGSGPNGRTISGVTYRFSANQIKIVCACHGSHMSPEEFVRHANEEYVSPEGGTGLATFPSTNPAASAHT